MNDTVLFDKLLRLRLPAFREGLREQQANPKYAELSFEERLALLVEQECTRRQNNRIHRTLRAAATNSGSSALSTTRPIGATGRATMSLVSARARRSDTPNSPK